MEDVRAVLDLRRGGGRQQAVCAGKREESNERNSTYAALDTRECSRPARKSRVPRSQSYFSKMSRRTSVKNASVNFAPSVLSFGLARVNQSLGSLKGITAWKDGTMYFASVDLWEGVKLDSLESSWRSPLARPSVFRRRSLGLFAFRCFLEFRAGNDGGRFRGLGFEYCEVAPLAALLGYHGNLEGVIRDVNLLFAAFQNAPLMARVRCDLRPTAFD